MYNRAKAVSDIQNGYKNSTNMSKKMRKLRDTIMRMNRRARRRDDVIQDKYKFKLKVQDVVTVPETYSFEYSSDIVTLLSKVDEPTFVLKPLHLSRGIGIRTLTRDGDVFRDINGDVLTMTDLKVEAGAMYKQQRLKIKSINGIMAEQRLMSHDSLQWYSAAGIADLRFMYYNKKFIMGLGRFPTLVSGEYGNIARGAKWGMFDALGRFSHHENYRSREIPNGKKLPFFKEMKEIGEKVVNEFGYIFQGVDMTVSRDGTVYVIESERTPQLEKYLTKEGVDWMWGIIEGKTWG